MIRNFHKAQAVDQTSHGGLGMVRSVVLYGKEEFQSGLNFLIYTELEPGTSIGVHTHGQNEEVYVILSGEGIMTIDGQDHPVSAGDAVLNRPGGSHGLANTGAQTLRILVFEAEL